MVITPLGYFKYIKAKKNRYIKCIFERNLITISYLTNAVEKDNLENTDFFYDVNCIRSHHKIIYNFISIFTCYKTNNIRQISVSFIDFFFFLNIFKSIKYGLFHKHNI